MSSGTHGMRWTRVYKTWRGMIDRCYGTAPQHKRYREKNIQVCNEWRLPEPFIEWALSHGYDDLLQIDRIDNNSNYEPENCRFVTAMENSNNRSDTRHIEFDGKKQSVSQWARELNINISTLFERLAHGWSNHKALTTPVKEHNWKRKEVKK